MGPSTKHFQQKRWLHESSTMSEMVSRQIGHCAASSSFLKVGDVGVSICSSRCPSDSRAVCSSAKSEPLKKLCRASQPARSEATSSMPRPVCFLRFFRIFTTATAFQTAYFRSRSTSPRMTTRRWKGPSMCRRLPFSHASSPSESAKLEIWFIRLNWRWEKQALTLRISLARLSSKVVFAVRKVVFAVRASEAPDEWSNSTTSLMLPLRSL
mmetsp:Transcript_28093/g.83689  ORF Transcript_28093/g.83689 Transcript_28093/m.83689 type:complete len:211 (-) Transcript_28093:168-800(-)